MARLHSEAQRLRAALLPLAAFAKNSRGKIDPTDPKAVFRLRHIQEVEAALVAAADYYEAADKILNPPDLPLVARIKRHLAQPSMVAFAALPTEVRYELGQVADTHLPRPTFPDDWPTR